MSLLFLRLIFCIAATVIWNLEKEDKVAGRFSFGVERADWLVLMGGSFTGRYWEGYGVILAGLGCLGVVKGGVAKPLEVTC